MRIVVCLKQIRHIYARTGMDPSTHFVSEEDSVDIVNPLDELAVEEAVRLKEALGGEAILVTLGDPAAEQDLRRCLAIGADRLIRIDDGSSEARDAWSTAVVLAAAIRRLSPDMVLCGAQALDDRCGHVGVTIAELLDYPCVSSIVRLDLDAGRSKAIVHRALERGDREVVECGLPALFTVCRGLNEPRYPRLEDLLAAQEAAIEVWGVQGLGIDSDVGKPLTKAAKLYPPRPRTKKAKAPGTSLSAQERIQMLMKGGATGPKKEGGKVVELSAGEAAVKVLDFIAGNRYL